MKRRRKKARKDLTKGERASMILSGPARWQLIALLTSEEIFRMTAMGKIKTRRMILKRRQLIALDGLQQEMHRRLAA